MFLFLRCVLYLLLGLVLFSNTAGACQCNVSRQTPSVLEQRKIDAETQTRNEIQFSNRNLPLTTYRRISRAPSYLIPIFSDITVDALHDIPLRKRSAVTTNPKNSSQNAALSLLNDREISSPHAFREELRKKARSNGGPTTPTSTKIIIAASGGISLLLTAGMILCLCERRTPPPTPASAKLLAGANAADQIFQKPGSPFSDDDWSVPTIVVTSMDETLTEQPSLISKRGRSLKEFSGRKKTGAFVISNPIIQVPPRSVSPGRSPIRPRHVYLNTQSPFPNDQQRILGAHPMRTGYGRYETYDSTPTNRSYCDVIPEYGVHGQFTQPQHLEVFKENSPHTGNPAYYQHTRYEVNESDSTNLAYLV